MGFPGHFKIPGHSGTDFKHRKAFTALKKYYQKRPVRYERTTADPVAKTTHTYQRQDRATLIIRRFILPTLFLIATGIFIYLIYSFSQYYLQSFSQTEQRIEAARQADLKQELQQAYRVLVKSGENYLRADKLDFAQEEFVRALRIQDDGRSARIGLTRTLIKQCHYKQVFCNDVDLHLQWIREHQLVDEEEIKNWLE